MIIVPPLKTLFHTVRYLRPVQIFGRIWFRLYRPKVQLNPPPPVRTRSANWVTPAQRQSSLLSPWVFRFLNEEHALNDIGDWDNPAIEKLWRYNLHYFDDLNAVEADFRQDWHRQLLDRWVRENPPSQGTGWEPYPTSLRIINWIKWGMRGHELSPQCLHSLAVQVRWLRRRLEIHLLGNHLFQNAKALVFAGLYFEGIEAQQWLEKGLSILGKEVPEQILKDGGQFERSTMYHALALEDMLDIVNLLSAFPNVIQRKWHTLSEEMLDLVDRMRHWLNVMCHPDKEISLFNDAAIGISPSPTELERYAVSLGFRPVEKLTDGITHLAESGYIRVQTASMVSLLDVAPVGPDYLPGHAHADTLTFETSLFGQRFIVDTGISKYGNDQERHKQRATMAHNTVCIDGQDSSEVWAGFRVARRAYPGRPEIEQAQMTYTVVCDHDGYKRLAGKCTHTRKWHFEDTLYSITDNVTGEFSNAMARFHIHPDVEVHAISGDSGVFELVLKSGHKVNMTIKGADSHSLNSTSWHPEFGVSRSNYCISASFTSAELITRISW